MGAGSVVAGVARERVEQFAERVRRIRASLHEGVVGQDEVIDQLLICAVTGSHALLGGVPGLAKTLMVKSPGRRFRVGVREDSVHARPDARRRHVARADDGISSRSGVRQPGAGR